MIAGRGLVEGYLEPEEVRRITREGIARLPLDGKRVLVIIPDGTRTMPVPLMVDVFATALAPRTAALDYLVALGTHPPMSDAQLTRLVGRPVADGRLEGSRIFNHRWDEPSTLRRSRHDPGSRHRCADRRALHAAGAGRIEPAGHSSTITS